VVNISSAMR